MMRLDLHGVALFEARTHAQPVRGLQDRRITVSVVVAAQQRVSSGFRTIDGAFGGDDFTL
jgi:hypothetical protein